jgi:hypothetical protein
MLTAKALTQEQMLSELIYEGEIHRLLKKNIIKRFFYTNVLKKILKSYLVLKTNGWLAIWLSLRKSQFFQNKRYAMIYFA